MHGKPKTNSAGLACFSLVQTMGLTNMVKGNTFLLNVGKAVTTLDLVLTDSPSLLKHVALENAVGASSHCRNSIVNKSCPKTHKTYNKFSWK